MLVVLSLSPSRLACWVLPEEEEEDGLWHLSWGLVAERSELVPDANRLLHWS